MMQSERDHSKQIQDSRDNIRKVRIRECNSAAETWLIGSLEEDSHDSTIITESSFPFPTAQQSSRTHVSARHSAQISRTACPVTSVEKYALRKNRRLDLERNEARQHHQFAVRSSHSSHFLHCTERHERTSRVSRAVQLQARTCTNK